MIRVWTDGCCLKNPGGAGSWAYVLERGDKVVRRHAVAVTATTNNKMELLAAIEGIRAVEPIMLATEEEIQLISDSTYVVKGWNEWLTRWKEKGWRRGNQKLPNVDLWQILDYTVAEHPGDVSFVWERGHSGSVFNEMADKMAGSAARAVS